MNAHLTSLERPIALHSPARPDSVAVIKASARQEPANPWITFALVAVGTFMIMLDASIVNISLPSIARTFHTPVGGAIEWIIIAYLVTIASTLLTFGRLSDMVGRKPVWLSGLALFTLGSGVCGAANSLSLLIAARAFQGLGGALLLSTSVAIITDSFSFDKRGFALGCNAVAIASSEQGESSGLLATGRVLGQSLSVALAGAIFAGLGGAEAGRTLIEAKTNYPGVEGGISAMQVTFLTGFHTALLVCAGIAAAGIFVALIRGPETEPVVRSVAKRQRAISRSAH